MLGCRGRFAWVRACVRVCVRVGVPPGEQKQQKARHVAVHLLSGAPWGASRPTASPLSFSDNARIDLGFALRHGDHRRRGPTPSRRSYQMGGEQRGDDAGEAGPSTRPDDPSTTPAPPSSPSKAERSNGHGNGEGTTTPQRELAVHVVGARVSCKASFDSQYRKLRSRPHHRSARARAIDPADRPVRTNARTEQIPPR